jgi:hypothetical protein
MKIVFNNSYLIPSLMREMAKYFCGFRPINNSNLFTKLIHELKVSLKETVFSTLNYDLIFELALQSQDLVAECFLEDTTDITYLKLHGSCNFVLESVGTWINCQFQGANAIESNLKALNADEVIDYCNSNDSLSPAMCVYMDSKPSQFGSGRIKAIQERWKNNVLEAERILIIGVKPYEADRHIWEPLIQTDAELGYIGSTDIFNKWVEKNRKNKMNCVIGDRWSDHFNDSVKFLLSKE